MKQSTRDDEPKVHEIGALFDDPERLEAAIGELESAGVDRARLSVLAREVEQSPPPPDMQSIEEDPALPREPPTTKTDVRQGRVLATSIGAAFAALAASGVTIMTGGAAAAAIAAAALAGGGVGLIGATAGTAAEERREDFLRKQLDRGGILLWVKVHDRSEEPKITKILERYGATGVHAHDIDVYPAR